MPDNNSTRIGDLSNAAVDNASADYDRGVQTLNTNYISVMELDDLLKDKAPETPVVNNTNSGGDTNHVGVMPSAFPRPSTQNKPYTTPGTLVAPTNLRSFLYTVLDEANRFSGKGSYTNIFQNFVSRLDRLGGTYTPLNTLNPGYTFITRPRLNLTGANLHQSPILTSLHTDSPDSVPFMIRMLLDSKMSRGMLCDLGFSVDPTEEQRACFEASMNSALFDIRNPFFVPLCNALKGISGFPDFNLQVETNEGDFHSGDFTYAKGSDFNRRTTDLSLEFRDVQGSIVLSCIYYWAIYIALQAKGVVLPYPDDEYEQRLNYTVSIYRFVMDPSKRNILWWAKATGCFPNSVPVGAIFNVNQDEVTLSSAMNFSIPFTANIVEVNDPAIFLDFNYLMQRYNPDITNDSVYHNIDTTSSVDNFNALPYVVSGDLGAKLVWRTSTVYDDGESKPIEDRMNEIDQVAAALIKEKYDTINGNYLSDPAYTAKSEAAFQAPHEGTPSPLRANKSAKSTTPP